ncbi:MAG: hypothetical protein UHE86_07970 [Acutalibacteraceae bacterium]|nr:hypothetical protein [Acutalibacteraceae bacterium]
MKPVEFKEQNVVYAKDQKEYMPLPALRFDDGTVISCWKMSWKELFKIVLHRKVWVSALTFNKPLQPLSVSSDSKELFKVENK